MPTTDDGQGMMPLQQKDKHMGNSRFGGGINMNDKDYSKIGTHMSAGHLDSLKDIYGEARREQLYNPVVEDSSALSMNSPLNDYKVTPKGVAPTEADTHPGHHDGPMKMNQDPLYQTAEGSMSGDVINEVLGGFGSTGQQTYNKSGRMMTDNSDGATMSREGGMYEHSDAYNEDFENGIKTNMKNLAIGSDERTAEYDRRGWAHDDTTKKKLK